MENERKHIKSAIHLHKPTISEAILRDIKIPDDNALFHCRQVLRLIEILEMDNYNAFTKLLNNN
jgi:hypothetical protein